MKFLIWIGLAVVILLLFRLLSPAKRHNTDRGDATARPPAPTDRATAGKADPQELMMRCSVCGVHVPSSEALFGRGRVYCSAAHRSQDESGQSNDA